MAETIQQVASPEMAQEASTAIETNSFDRLKNFLGSVVTSEKFVRNFSVTCGLGAVAVGYLVAQQHGLTNEISSPELQAFVESSAHPVLGYAGGWAADICRGDGKKAGRWAGVASAFVFDIAAETAQSAAIGEHGWLEYIETAENRVETVKDGVAAMAGLGIYRKLN